MPGMTNHTADQSPIIEPDRHELLPLKISRGVAGNPRAYSVVLGNTELTNHLLGFGGVKVEFIDYGDNAMPIQPTITLTFAPDAIDLNLDAVLQTYLRTKDALERKTKTLGG